MSRVGHWQGSKNQGQQAGKQAAKKKAYNGKSWPQAIVIATGPSLTAAQCAAAQRRKLPTIVVNDAWRLAPWADVLYACDAIWWQHSRPSAAEFAGERWSSHHAGPRLNDNKTAAAAEYGLNIVQAREEYGFCTDAERIHYGGNSGFQAINLAILFGAERVFLLGFDMQAGAKAHFFGDHPPEILKAKGRPTYSAFAGYFEAAARMLPPGIEITNCTPDSALSCFPRGTI